MSQKPINPENMDDLNEVAKAIKDRLPEDWGFICLAAPFGENGRLFYVSSIDRKSAINLLKEWLIKASAEEDWMKHIS